MVMLKKKGEQRAMLAVIIHVQFRHRRKKELHHHSRALPLTMIQTQERAAPPKPCLPPANDSDARKSCTTTSVPYP